MQQANSLLIYLLAIDKLLYDCHNISRYTEEENEVEKFHTFIYLYED